MDDEDGEPRKAAKKPKDLEIMSIEGLNDYIAEMEAEIARAREAIERKRKAMAGAHSLFKI